MATLEQALILAAKSHEGVTDKQGNPYILHAVGVMMGVRDPDARLVAVLHDVVEDTPVTLEDVKQLGFSDQVVEALDKVTHRDNQSYADYVIGCKSNPLARQVKLSDLRDNSRLDRALMRPELMARDQGRMARYLLSYRFLTDDLSEDDYRQAMTSL